MELRLLKSAALIAAVLASTCAPGKNSAGCSPPDRPSDGTRRAALSEPTDRRPHDEPRDRDVGNVASTRLEVGTDNDARHRGADVPERPWAHNTGPTNVGALVPSGSITISTNGAVVENLDVTGQITVTADNVTIRNFRVDASASPWYGIHNKGSNLLIEDGEIFGARSAGVRTAPIARHPALPVSIRRFPSRSLVER